MDVSPPARVALLVGQTERTSHAMAVRRPAASLYAPKVSARGGDEFRRADGATCRRGGGEGPASRCLVESHRPWRGALGRLGPRGRDKPHTASHRGQASCRDRGPGPDNPERLTAHQAVVLTPPGVRSGWGSTTAPLHGRRSARYRGARRPVRRRPLPGRQAELVVSCPVLILIPDALRTFRPRSSSSSPACGRGTSSPSTRPAGWCRAWWSASVPDAPFD